MHNNEQSVKEIQGIMAKWALALEKKDIEAMHQHHTKQYHLFDVGSTAHNIEESKKLWEECLPYFDKPKIEHKNITIEATENMAIVYFNSRLNGANMELPSEMENAWLRGTQCYRKIDGIWKCVHEHISFPVNCETNQINFEAAI